jgi:hypothetical protein
MGYGVTFFVVQFCCGQIWKQKMVAATVFYKGTDFTVE